MLIMTSPAAKQRGFSLIELMIGLVILGILFKVGLPSFSLWMQNTQNRTAAESVLNGLQLARTEAVKHNTNVRFDLTNNSGTTDWTVGCVTPIADLDGDGQPDCPAVIQSRSGNSGTGFARAGVSTVTPFGAYTAAIAAGTSLPAGVTFTGMGRTLSTNTGTDITRVDITNAAQSAALRMVITVGAGGTIRMCNPDLPLATSPQGCI